ncbi:transposase [Streptomyces sp. NPDC093598]|uniref:transposase n=1 Tax=Streptomyces sp. NPDC093598 TaxID=3366046 RepID=UPI003809BA06
MITDATGIPLAATLTGGNRNDVTQLIPLLEAVSSVRGKRGRPRRRPDVALGDRGYDPRQVPPPRPGARRETPDRTPRHRVRLRIWHQRWVVERAL